MALNNEDYTAEGIRNVPFETLLSEGVAVVRGQNQAEANAAQSYADNEIGESFAWMSESAVYVIKYRLIEKELERRDQEIPMTDEDREAGEKAVMMAALGLI